MCANRNLSCLRISISWELTNSFFLLSGSVLSKVVMATFLCCWFSSYRENAYNFIDHFLKLIHLSLKLNHPSTTCDNLITSLLAVIKAILCLYANKIESTACLIKTLGSMDQYTLRVWLHVLPFAIRISPRLRILIGKLFLTE